MHMRMVTVIAISCLGIAVVGFQQVGNFNTSQAETTVAAAIPDDKTSAEQKTPDVTKFALLVGCTHYEGAASKLRGPINDVKLLKKTLMNRFGFKAENMKTLVGWPDDLSQRPTNKNITQAFEELVKKAKPNSQIVILLSGHGSQIPVPKSQTSLLDPNNREPDGMDEVFLPSDCTNWTDDSLPNCITDNQIASLLNRIKTKGANVWLICDCCHSGTLSKSGGPPAHGIRWRKLDPHTDLGIPNEVLEAARKRAAALGGSKGLSRLESPVKITAGGSTTPDMPSHSSPRNRLNAHRNCPAPKVPTVTIPQKSMVY